MFLMLKHFVYNAKTFCFPMRQHFVHRIGNKNGRRLELRSELANNYTLKKSKKNYNITVIVSPR